MVGRARHVAGGLCAIVSALTFFDCAGILGINPTIVDDGEGGGGSGGGGGTGFQAPTIDAPTVPFDSSCIKSVRAIYTDGNFAPDTISADDRGVFWSGNYDSETGYLRALTAEGSTTVIDHDYAIQGTAIDRDHLYFSTMNDYSGAQGPGQVRAWDRGAAHGLTTLGFGSAPPGVGLVVIDGADLFFGTYTFLADAGGGVFKASTPFGESATASSLTPAISPFHLAADSQTVYFDEAPDGFLGSADGYHFSRVSKVSRSGGAPSIIEDDTVVADIAVANGLMYWATDALGVIRVYDGQQVRDYARVSGTTDLAPDLDDGQMYALSVPDLDHASIVRFPLGQLNAPPKNCVGPMANTYAIAYYGHHLYFGARGSENGSPAVLYDAEVNP